jgi:transcriptional regulator with XRE-family HTH domain
MIEESWDDRDFASLARRYLSDTTTRSAFLRQAWLARAIASLRDARVNAELTQTEVAGRLGTTQSAIARLERDDSGSISLHRYIDFALACGAAPFDVALISTAELASYAVTQPLGPWTQLSFDTWIGQATASNVARFSFGSGVQGQATGVLARPEPNTVAQQSGSTETVRGQYQKVKAA